MSFVVMRVLHDPLEGDLPRFLIEKRAGTYAWVAQHEYATNHELKKHATRECAVAVLDYAGCGYDFSVVEV